MEQVQLPYEAGRLWAILAEAAHRLEYDAEDAARLAQKVLKLTPGQPQALQILVATYRIRGDLAGARATLEAMTRETPQLAAIHYELGLLLFDIGDPEGARGALSRVVELEPKHPQAWQALGDVMMRTGETAGAASAYGQQFASSIMDLKTLEQVGALDPEQAETAVNVLREYLNAFPTDVGALQVLGRLHMRAAQFESAEKIFARALEIAPAFRSARLDCISALQQQLRRNDEIRQLDILLETEPDNLALRALRASALSVSGRADEAVRCSAELVQADPGQPDLWITHARALRGAGRQEDCIAAFRGALRLEPTSGSAWWGLADLKTFRFTPADVEAMRTALARDDLSIESREYLLFALGKALEDEGAYEDSFRNYSIGNELVRARNPYDADSMAKNVGREKGRFSSEFYRAAKSPACQSTAPIFIVGVPRSGSTLVEQILASHSSVEGAGELPTLTALVRRLEGKRADRMQSGLDDAAALFQDENYAALGEEYLEHSRRWRKLQRPYFTDKMLSNFHHLGMICTILPNARIIDVRRHPLACCFSNFKQIFPYREGPSYNLADMGRYYRGYVELMVHFDRVLPGRIHRIIYEDLVQNPEREVRALLEYCGLGFEESCLRFHETRRGVLTVSSEQVKQPLYSASVEQWRHYEPWLGPLKASLGPVLDVYPGVPDVFGES